jgi:hypothetical protein
MIGPDVPIIGQRPEPCKAQRADGTVCGCTAWAMVPLVVITSKRRDGRANLTPLSTPGLYCAECLAPHPDQRFPHA